MELTRAERWILLNQYRLIELLDPNNAKECTNARIILERGYELEYASLCQHMHDLREPMPDVDCRNVCETVFMFAALRRAYEQLDDYAKADIKEADVAFLGFDGNSGSGHMAYLQFRCDREFPFEVFDHSDNLNSHSPMLALYERMLTVWREISNSADLTEQQLRDIVAARVAP